MHSFAKSPSRAHCLSGAAISPCSAPGLFRLAAGGRLLRTIAGLCLLCVQFLVPRLCAIPRLTAPVLLSRPVRALPLRALYFALLRAVSATATAALAAPFAATQPVAPAVSSLLPARLAFTGFPRFASSARLPSGRG